MKKQKPLRAALPLHLQKIRELMDEALCSFTLTNARSHDLRKRLKAAMKEAKLTPEQHAVVLDLFDDTSRKTLSYFKSVAELRKKFGFE